METSHRNLNEDFEWALRQIKHLVLQKYLTEPLIVCCNLFLFKVFLYFAQEINTRLSRKLFCLWNCNGNSWSINVFFGIHEIMYAFQKQNYLRYMYIGWNHLIQLMEPRFNIKSDASIQYFLARWTTYLAYY